MTRQYSSISVATTLASSISSGDTTIYVASGTGSALMGGVTLAAGNVDQFTVALDPDTTNEEIVFVTAVSGDTLTVVRGRAGSTAITHSSGATVQHVLTSDDLNAFKLSISPVANMSFAGSTSGATTVQATAVAGTTTVTLPAATDTLVGQATTDTLTNKTLTAPLINLAINAQTGTTYTPVLADNGKLITLSNASAITVTIPTNASVTYPTGAQINIQQIGAGQVSVVGDTGVTVTGTGTSLRLQYSAATLVKTGTNSWNMIGDLA